jgi:hypothetical protein
MAVAWGRDSQADEDQSSPFDHADALGVIETIQKRTLMA